MPKHPWIEFPLCFLAVVGPVVMILCRCLIKKEIRHTDGSIEKRPWGIGVRMIQLVAILILGPVVAVLGLEGTLSGEGTGTLMGAIVGYALGGITSPVPKDN